MSRPNKQREDNVIKIALDPAKASGFTKEGAVITGGQIVPQLDPNSPEFDIEAYKKFLLHDRANIAKALSEIQKTMSAAIVAPLMDFERFSDSLKFLVDGLKETISTNFGHDPLFDDLEKVVKEFIQQNLEAADLYKELEPYIDEELKKPEYAGKDVDEISEETIDKILAAAQEAYYKASVPSVTVKRKDDYTHPMDKPNNVIWNILEKEARTQINGQLGIADLMINTANAADNSKGIQRLVGYSISFSDLDENNPIMKKLTPFDKRVYFAIANLYTAGNEIVSATMIYHFMGNTGRPNQRQRENIFKSIEKMMGAVISLDNLQELEVPEHPEAKPYKYDRFQYKGNLLHAEIIKAYINGKITDDTIHILDLPVLYKFAAERNQITTFRREVLEIPLDQSNETFSLEDYLIEEISRMKAGSRNNNKMLYSTIFESLRIQDSSRMKKKRTKEKIRIILDYWKTAESAYFIKGYTEDSDSITIICDRDKKTAASKKKTRGKK